MGYMRHHAIVVTSWSDKHIQAAHKAAKEIYSNWSKNILFGAIVGGFDGLVSPIMCSPINSYMTFIVAPDGSKEGWDDSDEGNFKRDELIEWLEGAERKDNFDWAEIEYGGDGDGATVLRHEK